MIRATIASCFALLFFTAHGFAKDDFTPVADGYDPAAQEEGAIAKWAMKYGTRTLVYLGPDGDQHRYEWRTKLKGPEQVTKLWRDGDAQMTRMEYDNVEQIYEPHDCRLTVGRCEYTYTYVNETLGENRQERYIVINSVDDTVWSYKRYIHSEAPENLRSEGTFTVDAFGTRIDGKSKGYSKGSNKPRKGWMKRFVPAKR